MKTLFSEDESKQYVVFGSKKEVESFGLGQLFSVDLFPEREYYDSVTAKRGAYFLRAKHTHRSGRLQVLVFTTDN